MTGRHARALLRLALASAVAVAALACASEGDSPSLRARSLGKRLEGHPQARRLTCESRSAADLLAAHGLPGTEEDVFARVPRSEDPDLGFVGDPDGEPGQVPPAPYGVHAEPIAAALRSMGLDARAVRGSSLDALRAETTAGRPVIAWVTGSFAPSRAVDLTDSAGHRFRAVAGEHTVLVLDSRGGTVLALDPASGRRVEVPESDFAASWSLLGQMAVFASGPAGASPR